MLFDARLLVLALVVFVSSAHAQVYKCTDAAGRTTYGDEPCASTGKRLKVPESDKPTLDNATVCRQLQDEMQRLSSQEAREAKRGQPKDALLAKRRATLLAQYHRRCAAISHSAH
jgi:hypothetical protein